MGLAHQLGDPGIRGDGFGQQLGAFLQAMLGAVERHALDLGLLADLQLPEGFALLQRAAAEKGEEQRQTKTPPDDYSVAGIPVAGIPVAGIPVFGARAPEPARNLLRHLHAPASGQPGQAAQTLHFLAVGVLHFGNGQAHENGFAARVARRQAIAGADQLTQHDGQAPVRLEPVGQLAAVLVQGALQLILVQLQACLLYTSRCV